MSPSPDECAGQILEVVPAVMRAIRAEMRSHRAPDISVSQFRALAFINRREGASLSDLAEHIGLTLPSMSKMVDGLVARNLVKREAHPRDRRRLTLALTRRGRAMQKSARAATQRFLAAHLATARASDRAAVAQAMAVLRPLFTSGNEPMPRLRGDTVSILKTEALTRCFGTLKAVDALSLAVEAGEVFGLLGPNGAGKTTVIKMLTTLLPPTSGNASVGGFDVVRRAGDVRRIIGYVPQMLSADGTLTGYENLLIFAKLYDLPRAERKSRVQKALELMGLTEAADRLVRTYSGGMIRRLEIAQSMLHEPKVLFLDEPTIGLDPLARQAVWDRIRQLQHRLRHDDSADHALYGRGRRPVRPSGHHAPGQVRAIGAPDELKAAIGGDGATLEQVFAHYAGACHIGIGRQLS